MTCARPFPSSLCVSPGAAPQSACAPARFDAITTSGRRRTSQERSRQDTKFHTLCVEWGATFACPFSIPIEQTNAVEHFPDSLPEDADRELRAHIEQLKKSDYEVTSRIDYHIDAKGFVHIGALRGGTIHGYQVPKSGPLFR